MFFNVIKNIYIEVRAANARVDTTVPSIAMDDVNAQLDGATCILNLSY